MAPPHTLENYEELFLLTIRKHLINMTHAERDSLKVLGDDWFFDGLSLPPEFAHEMNKEIMTTAVIAPECRYVVASSKNMQKIKDFNDSDEFELIIKGIVPKPITLDVVDTGRDRLVDFAEAIADHIDSAIMSSIINHETFNTRSILPQSVGGYVPSGDNDGLVMGDCLREMLYHFPTQGKRGVWYMNKMTGLKLLEIPDGEGYPIIDPNHTEFNKDGLPNHLFGTRIVYTHTMPNIRSGSIPIILADLARGYVVVRDIHATVRRMRWRNIIKFFQTGVVVDPSAFKAIRIAKN